MRTTKRQETPFVRLDARKCRACWACEANCPEIIGRISVLWHKHALIKYPDRCIGCMQCVRLCRAGAFTPVQKARR